jgi:RHS repeat-associated protein
VSLKRYRYTGKERDEENGFTYHARYYAPWLGRWISTDPMGINSSADLYRYAHDSPVTFFDPKGLQEKTFITFEEETVSGTFQRATGK